MEKPLQSLFTFPYIAVEKYYSDRFVVIFFGVYSLNALQSDNYSTRVYFLGHKYILGPSQSSF